MSIPEREVVVEEEPGHYYRSEVESAIHWTDQIFRLSAVYLSCTAL